MNLLHRVRDDWGGQQSWKWGLPLGLFMVGVFLFAVISGVLALVAMFVRFVARLLNVSVVYIAAGLAVT
ncbi:MAG: hypothetical protein QOG91_482 [Candidatus Parcubacteria bacterium]|jgi:hypothetical protein|nr:hypothetical protein [Candidatus Parcubacteria bacterium]